MKTGFKIDKVAVMAEEPVRVTGSSVEIVDNPTISLADGRKAQKLPFTWGDQPAACYAVFSPSGEFLEFQKGTGDRAPYVTEDGHFSCDRDEE